MKYKKELCIMPQSSYYSTKRDFRHNERHEVFFSKAYRQKSINDGLVVFLTAESHRGDTEFKIINAYYGSSSFNSKQMSRLIDGVVQDCKPYGIETKPQQEINSLLKEWDKK